MLHSLCDGWTDQSLALSEEITDDFLCKVLFVSFRTSESRLLRNFQGCDRFLETIL